jgi:ATP-dependent Clp protease ATP-binding subunit ClpA
MNKNNIKISVDLKNAIKNAEVISYVDYNELNAVHLFVGIWNNDSITQKIIKNIGNAGYYKILNGICADLRDKLTTESKSAIEIIESLIEEFPEKTINSINVLDKILSIKDETINKWVGGITFDFMNKSTFELVEQPDEMMDDEPHYDDNTDGSMLDRWCTNLNKKCKERGFDAVIARDAEIRRIENILCRRKKNNPVLVGDPGVGKTAIIEGLVGRIVSGDIHGELRNKVIYATTAGELTSGARFRGDLEERVEGIISELEQDRNKILFIDEIHTVMKKSSDIADLIKPALSGKNISCIGATTNTEWRKYFSKDGAMSRRMSVVQVNEPSLNDTIDIVKSTKANIEEFHGVSVNLKVVERCVRLADKWISDNQFPYKAFDVIDDSCVLARQRGSKRVSQADVDNSIHNLTSGKMSGAGIKVKSLSTIQNRIQKTLMGQDVIINEVCDFIRVAESGLGDDDKPKGVFLFRGISGVGKTALSKAISTELKLNLIKVDMGEYSESHSVSKIIGSPPGYVGHDEGGKITELVHRNPHSVIILDEIEKAHRNVLNALLGVFDEGYMTDSAGRKIDFSNAYIIMTSNVASKEGKKGKFGFTGSGGGLVNAEIIRVFSSEFVNRINYIAHFATLDENTINIIVSAELKKLKGIMNSKGIDVVFSRSCKSEVSRLAIKEKMGARPISRIIHNKIKPILSKLILDVKSKKAEIYYEKETFKIKT